MTTRRELLKGLAQLPFVGALIPAARKPPNVLLILADDQNLRLGCYGDGYAKTPNIDRLAKRSLRFDQAIVQYPLCNPSRTSFFSGLRPRTTTVVDNKVDPRMVVKEPLLHDWFLSHGYWTACAGKALHFPDPGRWNFFQALSKTPATELLGKHPFLWGYDTRTPELDFHDVVVAKDGVRLLGEARSAPFFVALGFRMPHVPLLVPERFGKLFPSPPAVPSTEESAIPAVALAHLGPECRLDAAQQSEFRRAYYAGGAFLDAQIGSVLDVLDRQRLWETTVVVFVSDNGFSVGERGLWGKVTLFDESARVPLLIHAPGFDAGSCDRLVELVDLFPTLAALCGLPAPAGLEGVDLSPLLRNPASEWQRPAFSQVDDPIVKARGVWHQRLRYAEWMHRGKPLAEELYDHESDQGERVNRVAEAPYAAARVELKALLEARFAVPRSG